MFTKGQLLSAICGLVLVANAQLPTPTTTAGIPIVEGALSYQGPPVIGYTGPGGNASIQSNNPQATYVATFPTKQFDSANSSQILGTVTVITGPQGTGVSFNIQLSGFPSESQYGPFVYHIHQMAVPADGNCTATGPHLDPTQRGELHACEVAAPQTCQAGDLAGKHGNITTPQFTASYVENYLSTTPGSAYFFGDKAIVVHTSNTTRLTCANFVLQGSSSNGSSSGSNTTASGTSTPTATGSPIATGAAAKVASVSFTLVVLAAALLL